MSMVIDMSSIDTLKYTGLIREFKQGNRFVFFSNIYIYSLKIRLTLMCNINKFVKSVDSIYKNTNWLERETSEMYGINFIFKKDSRPLLLDYSRNQFPMLKDFPSEGYNDIYYNFFENKLTYVNNEFIEL